MVGVMEFDENTERLLLANDSSVTAVAFDSSDVITGTPSRLGTALRGNTHVTYLIFNLENSVERDDFTGTIQFIQESASLKEFRVYVGRLAPPVAPLVGQLLHAAGRNPSIKDCCLYNTGILANDLASLLHSSSIDDLYLSCCELLRGGTTSDEAAMELITGAFVFNTTLATLSLDWIANNGQFMQGILRGLPGHSTLHCLQIGNITKSDVDTMAASTALVELLASSTCPLKKLEFHECEWDELSFMAIASCLRSSAKVSRISFFQCKFDEASSLLLASIFRSNGSANELILGHGVTFPDNTDVLGSLVESSSHLSGLDLTEYNRLNDSSNGLEAILIGLKAKTSKVEAILLPSLTPAQCIQLLASLPAFRGLKRLACTLDARSAPLKYLLLDAFLHNGCIVDTNILQAPFFNETNRAKLCSYARRNEMLTPIIEYVTAVDSMEIHLVPRLLRLSFTAMGTAGLSNVVCALVRLGDRIGSNIAERGPAPKKRHRQQMIDS